MLRIERRLYFVFFHNIFNLTTQRRILQTSAAGSWCRNYRNPRLYAASSLNELRLAREELHAEVHSYCPAYTPDTIGEYLDGSTHITFNCLGAGIIEIHGYTHIRHGIVNVRYTPQPEFKMLYYSTYMQIAVATGHRRRHRSILAGSPAASHRLHAGGMQASERVTLMTAHAAKGLEFGNVFVVGVEEDRFSSTNPSVRRRKSPSFLTAPDVMPVG